VNENVISFSHPRILKSNEQFGVNYTINKYTIDRFKILADKDMKKMSNIVKNSIRRYVESRV
jgi:hypothetical protein